MSELIYVEAGSKFPTLKPGVLRLYSSKICPYCQRVRLILAARYHQPFELVEVNLKNKPEWFQTDINADDTCPVLQYGDGKIVHESLVIAEHLDTTLPGKKLSPTANSQAKQQQDDRLKLFGQEIESGFGKFVYGHMKDALVGLKEGLKKFDGFLGDAKFFGGVEVGFLDLMIWPWFERLEVLKETFGFDISEFPRLAAWSLRMKQLDFVRAITLEVGVFQKYMAGI